MRNKVIGAALLCLAIVAGCGGSAQNSRSKIVQSTVNPPTVPELLPPPPPDTVTIRFIGDVMLHTGQIEAARRRAALRNRTDSLGTTSSALASPSPGFDFTPFLDSIAPDLRAADLAIAGMEFTLGGEPYTGYPQFSAPDSYAEYVADCGVDVFLAANNHILDRGAKGLRRTISYYDKMESEGRISYTGIGAPQDTVHNPLIVRVKNQLIGIVNYTYGTNCYPELDHCVLIQQGGEVLPLVAKARERGADFIIVCPHWGDEYQLKHNALQEKWARLLADEGADLIIGAHPHVVQDTAVIKTVDGRLVPVYYSIGNAVSNMSAPNTQDELMVTARISEGELVSVSHDRLRCTRPGQLTDSFATVKVK